MADPTPLRLGWIGLGSMGLAMAQNIQKHLYENNLPALRYSNRTLSRGEPLEGLGGVPDVIFISVSDDLASKTVIEGILSSGSVTSKIILDTTTVHPDTTSSVSIQVQEAGALFIAGPVFGATPLAQAGKVLMAVAGPPQAIKIVSPFLKGVIARNVIEVDSDPSKALLLKTTSNFITAGLMFLLSEAHVLAEKSGLAATVLECLTEENFGAYAHGVSQRLTTGAYYPAEGKAPSSGLELGIKDVGIGMGVAKGVSVELKVGQLSMRAMEEAKVFGDEKGRKMDSSSVYGVVRQRAGLDFESESVKKRDAEQ
ncbi:NAD(P)-binding protein [Pleomassaria siparia CBS 279.74]|uniref:NAD(P)-binding protein n=1 Tax=Pleomassaria siparia CBS 279.74 TaxID=1314801 RepID=A0A6G1JW02_9PLEO|nr:NAD(P)-binding protein [Pleomassaria siparia CBS 279.74]